MEKIILYYKFTPVADPDMTMRWQRELCERLDLKGRIIISPHGINGTIGGDMENVKAYVRAMNVTKQFKRITYKWSDGKKDHFPKLSIRVRDELVAFKAADEVVVSERGVENGGVHLKPEQVHKLIQERGDEVVFFDGRNAYEAQVGKFKNAVIPNVKTTPDFLKELEDPKYDSIKERPIVTYCTGGIRCEILSVLMKNRGFKEVYQIDGGIVKYGEKYGDDGLWEGSLYIFDGRMNHRFSANSQDIGECVHCHGKTSNFENCANKACNRLVLVCENCASEKDRCVDCAKDLQAIT
jgi:UPF0176 protein